MLFTHKQYNLVPAVCVGWCRGYGVAEKVSKASHRAQLSLAIQPWVGAVSSGDGHHHCWEETALQYDC